jgi:hypothetical protein
MRVTQRTPDVLVIEEDASTKIMIGSFCAGLGGFAAIVGWTKGQTLFMIVGTVFVLFGLKICFSVGRGFTGSSGGVELLR